jgi:hypothetical protein
LVSIFTSNSSTKAAGAAARAGSDTSEPARMK